MLGKNVLHCLGYDAFGLPAEQYAVQTGQHPRKTTEDNMVVMRRQLRRLGLGFDDRRSYATIDEDYFRWTQWIFLQIYNSWYDPDAVRPDGGRGAARPIETLVEAYASGRRPLPDGLTGRSWAELSEAEQEALLAEERLAYPSEAPVNWSPGLGTVLSNEEVTNEGLSERGNFPVFRRSLSQWMMRITAYADRLADDLDRVDWPEKVKIMQRNWIGRSQGARDPLPRRSAPRARSRTSRSSRPVRTRVFGATFMVLAPEHPLVDQLVPDGGWPDGTQAGVDRRRATTPREAVAAYRQSASRKSEVERQMEGRDKTGVFVGVTARNPVNGDEIPVFVADYVLLGYGTGAIMARPRSGSSGLGVRDEVRPAHRPHGAAAGGSSGRRGLPRRRSEHQLQQRRGRPERPADRGRQGAHRRVARGQGLRSRHHQLPAARLAVQPAALLG